MEIFFILWRQSVRHKINRVFFLIYPKLWFWFFTFIKYSIILKVHYIIFYLFMNWTFIIYNFISMDWVFLPYPSGMIIRITLANCYHHLLLLIGLEKDHNKWSSQMMYWIFIMYAPKKNKAFMQKGFSCVKRINKLYTIEKWDLTQILVYIHKWWIRSTKGICQYKQY